MKRMVLPFLWAIILFVFTCTDNLDALLSHTAVHFHWTSTPNFSDLLVTSDAHVTDPYWLFIKSGHFCGFAILDILLYRMTGRLVFSSLVTVLYGVSTEILQLFFTRDGRFLDMGIDSTGVLLSYILQRKQYRRRRRIRRYYE